MTKITDKMRRDWLMRNDTAISKFFERSKPIWIASKWLPRLRGLDEYIGRTKALAVNEAIRAEQKSKVKK